MRHSNVEDWSPGVLAQSGLFEGINEWPTAVLDAPVIILQPHEPLAQSRSGHPLAVFVIAGEVRQYVRNTSRSYPAGALIGVRELASTTGSAADLVAASESVVMLLDKHRIHALCKSSQAFALHILASLLELEPDVDLRAEDIAISPDLFADAVMPSGLRSVVLVRLVNREALELCHGAQIAWIAIRSIGRAVDLSTRPGDIRTFLGGSEFLIAIEGDRLAASIIATRLVSRCSRIMAIADTRVPLPHLHIVVGMATVELGDTMAMITSRARTAALKAFENGETFGG